MRTKKSYFENIKSSLVSAGIYSEHKDALIQVAADCQYIIATMKAELPKGTLMLTQIGSNQQEKRSLHPLIPAIRDYSATLERTLRTLYGDYKPDGEDAISDLISQFQ